MIRVIILAAGKGSRMKTSLPKSAYPLFGTTMIEYLINTFYNLNIKDIYTIIGYKKEEIIKIIKGKTEFIIQNEQKGTGSAIMACKKKLKNKKGNTIIIPSDMPLVSNEIITNLISYHHYKKNDLTIVTTLLKNPKGYGRIYKQNNKILKIIEEKDCNEEEKKIKEINTSLYCINNELLFRYIDLLKPNNNQNEYYLTDIIEIFINNNLKVDTLLVKNNYKLVGINDLYTLTKIEKKLQKEINKKFLLNGIYLENPDTIIIHNDVIIKSNTKILQNSIILGNTLIKENNIIGPNTQIIDSKIDKNCLINNCYIKNSHIKENTKLKPFNTIIDNRCD